MPTPTVFSTDGYDVHPDWTAPEHDRFGRYMARDRLGTLIIPDMMSG